MQAATGYVADDGGEQVDGGVVAAGARGDVIQGRDDLHVAGAAQRDAALAVLRRLHGVGLLQRARRLGDGAEVARHHCQRLGFVEFAGDDQHRVVRLVVMPVKRLQPFDGYVLDVRARAYGGAAVAVPDECGGGHALSEHAKGAVLARLEFVAHHRHLGVKVGTGDARIDHAVGFDFERPVEVGRRGGEGLVVIGAIERCRAVPARALGGELGLDVRVAGGALEQQVLQQVGHARLAVALVARTDEVDDIDGHGVERAVGHQQHLQAVIEAVFGNALDRCEFDRTGALGECAACANE